MSSPRRPCSQDAGGRVLVALHSPSGKCSGVCLQELDTPFADRSHRIRILQSFAASISNLSPRRVSSRPSPARTTPPSSPQVPAVRVNALTILLVALRFTSRGYIPAVPLPPGLDTISALDMQHGTELPVSSPEGRPGNTGGDSMPWFASDGEEDLGPVEDLGPAQDLGPPEGLVQLAASGPYPSPRVASPRSQFGAAVVPPLDDGRPEVTLATAVAGSGSTAARSAVRARPGCDPMANGGVVGAGLSWLDLVGAGGRAPLWARYPDPFPRRASIGAWVSLVPSFGDPFTRWPPATQQMRAPTWPPRPAAALPHYPAVPAGVRLLGDTRDERTPVV